MEFDWSSIIKPSRLPIDAEQLRLFEHELGFLLPEDYKAFLLTLNGGKVTIDHEIHVPELCCDVFVNDIWPLTEASPSLGVKESRDLQVRNRLGFRQAFKIGDNMGTGFFFLILDGQEKGTVYFAFKDDLPLLEGDWYSYDVRIPKCFAKISSSFNELGEAIVLNKK